MLPGEDLYPEDLLILSLNLQQQGIKCDIELANKSLK